ncbi:MAG TPA: hypothetical protein VGO18_21020 [Steroidobacteraceae bacterium]|jgi:F0F1-type ATP synthase membrane subunit c/vacuolar-type H+-ATPase subunit K|nr:hypothetical protein [Steroidobacteraceae bacterium]
MKLSQLILTAASIPIGGAVGAMVGLDARSNKWSGRPIMQFAIAGAILIVPVAIYVLLISG